TLRVTLPAFSRVHQFANDIVIGDGSGKCIIKAFHFSRGKHEVIANRRVSVGIVLRCQPELRGQAVQIWHVGIANDLRVAVILFYDEKHMPEERLARSVWVAGSADAATTTSDGE